MRLVETVMVAAGAENASRHPQPNNKRKQRLRSKAGFPNPLICLYENPEVLGDLIGDG
jgi:hypothetical protein